VEFGLFQCLNVLQIPIVLPWRLDFSPRTYTHGNPHWNSHTRGSAENKPVGEARGFAVEGGRSGGLERSPLRGPGHSGTSVVRGYPLVPEIFFIGSVQIS